MGANYGDSGPAMLSGLKVLDFTQYLAGPTVTRLMAEMGAEIIKIEQAPDGDPSRLLPAVKTGAADISCNKTAARKASSRLIQRRIDPDSPFAHALSHA